MSTMKARLALLVVLLPSAACRAKPPAYDLFRPDALREAQVAGKDRGWAAKEEGRLVRLNDVVRRTLPASPPSRLRFVVDIPSGAHLSVACGIAPRFQDRPGVEFMVKVRAGTTEDVAWTLLVDPMNQPKHHEWVAADVDLSRWAGQGRELILETTGFEEKGVERAYWGDPALHVPQRAAPVVIIWLVDTLRADHTTPYGYGRETTPALDSFAQDSVVFETAIAQASWTKPSVASILTSELPGIHRAVQLRDPLDSGQVTLAEMLQAKGYATGAAIAHWVIYSEGNNFEQGFDTFVGLHDPSGRPSKEVQAAEVVDSALAWLDARRGVPVFLYAHTMDPHVPYSPPAPFDRRFKPGPTEGHPGVDPRTDYREPEDRDRLVAQYDGDVAYGDQEFGRFLRGLKSRGLYDRALIVFMADHGEEFLDHGGWLHGRTVFDELIRVPLVVKFPGQRWAGRRIGQQVQTVDVLPTILANEGLPVPPLPAIAGLPLQGVVKGSLAERPAVSEISHRGFVAHSMRTSHDKYIHRFSPDPEEMYFDLVRDPTEQTNRIEESRERARVLKASVEEAMVASPFRYKLRLVTAGRYALDLETGGWIEGVQTLGLGPREKAEVEANGRRLKVLVSPQRGRPREVTFGIRPLGVHVALSGTRDGRPLRPADILVGSEGGRPHDLPFELPDLEEGGSGGIFGPPPVARGGLQIWLEMASGRHVLELDKDAQERLKALGYLGPN
jgi:arylsulfatase A-like enzyme